MSDSLLELLSPHIYDADESPHALSLEDSTVFNYLHRLTHLSIPSLSTTEPQSISHQAQTVNVSLQALTSRSHKPIIEASDHVSTISRVLPQFALETTELQDAIPRLDEEAVRFSQSYGKTVENELLDRRKRMMLLSRNIDRVADILDLPSLLSSAISSASMGGAGAASSSSSAANYASALDLHSHIIRLHKLYPDSPLVSSVAAQAEEAIRGMTTSLISSLKATGVKLAGGMRTVGWLRRVAPELDEQGDLQKGVIHEGSLGAIFLVCRLANLVSMLDALEPLRELADGETDKRLDVTRRRKSTSKSVRADGSVSWSGGQQTERYLKRYIEIFREQSFAIVSMFKSIFPSSSSADENDSSEVKQDAPKGASGLDADPLMPLPSALTMFPLHLVDLLAATLRTYLPNVQDKGSRESLYTQLLYCAGSLGRLGGDFSMILAVLDDETGSETEDEDETRNEAMTGDDWIEAIKKHRELAGRLDLLASGVGRGGQHTNATGRKASTVEAAG